MTPPQNLLLALLLVGGVFVLAVFAPLLRLLIRRWTAKPAAKAPAVQGRRCVCGYVLVGLSLPRCPECGRAIGFNKTFEELGLTDEELARLRELGEKQPPAPPPAPSA